MANEIALYRAGEVVGLYDANDIQSALEDWQPNDEIWIKEGAVVTNPSCDSAVIFLTDLAGFQDPAAIMTIRGRKAEGWPNGEGSGDLSIIGDSENSANWPVIDGDGGKLNVECVDFDYEKQYGTLKLRSVVLCDGDDSYYGMGGAAVASVDMDIVFDGVLIAAAYCSNVNGGWGPVSLYNYNRLISVSGYWLRIQDSVVTTGCIFGPMAIASPDISFGSLDIGTLEIANCVSLAQPPADPGMIWITDSDYFFNKVRILSCESADMSSGFNFNAHTNTNFRCKHLEITGCKGTYGCTSAVHPIIMGTGGTGTRIEFDHATITNNHSPGSANYGAVCNIMDSGELIFKNSIIYGNTYGDFNDVLLSYHDSHGISASFVNCDMNEYYVCSGGSVTQTDCLNEPPLFVGSGDYPYQLTEDSPCVDAGVAIADITEDIIGNPVPQGKGYDIGAYESPYQSGGDVSVLARIDTNVVKRLALTSVSR